MRGLALLLGILGVFVAVLWHVREPEPGGVPRPDVGARVHTVDLADAPAFQTPEPASQPAQERAPEPEAPLLQESPMDEALETERNANPPAAPDEPAAAAMAFDPDRSTQLVRRLLSLYARLRGEDAEAAP